MSSQLPSLATCISTNEGTFEEWWGKTINGCRELFRLRILDGEIDQWQENFVIAFQILLDFQGGQLRGPLESELVNSQNFIRQSCIRTPGMCDLALDDYCSQFTREQIEARPELIDFCGCFSPSDPFIESEWDILNPGEPFPKPCDPLCNRIDSVKLASDELLQSAGCEANLCVINNVTVTGNNQVSIGQQCLGCSSTQPCLCILDRNLVIGNLNGCSEALCFTAIDGPAGPILTAVECQPAVIVGGETQTTLAVSLIISVGVIAVIILILFSL